MNEYLILVAGGEHTVKATSEEEAIQKLPESERPWVLSVHEVVNYG
jgi:hypothetical protein